MSLLSSEITSVISEVIIWLSQDGLQLFLVSQASCLHLLHLSRKLLHHLLHVRHDLLSVVVRIGNLLRLRRSLLLLLLLNGSDFVVHSL
jgi:hypothetical protein